MLDKVASLFLNIMGELTEISRELDHQDKIVMKTLMNCSTPLNDYGYIYFLLDNGDFEHIRGEIMRKISFPIWKNVMHWFDEK